MKVKISHLQKSSEMFGRQIQITRNSASVIREIQKWLSGLENLGPHAKTRLYLSAHGIGNSDRKNRGLEDHAGGQQTMLKFKVSMLPPLNGICLESHFTWHVYQGEKKNLSIYFCSFILKGCFLGFSKEQIDLSAAKGNRLRAFMCTSHFQLQLCIHSCDQNRLLKEGHAVLHPLPQHK